MRRPRRVAIVVVAAIAAASVASAIATRHSHKASRTIPQPSLAKLNDRTRRRLAPAAKRVDLVAPSFSARSTTITNPLFPVSRLHSAVLVGKLDGVPWRAETTLLPGTETVRWNGVHVRTLRSQFVAYLAGRIFEVAVDRYAEADDGSVWYFGEDAYTYERGRVSDTEGTWLAGVNGPPAMIMPAQPRVGGVYRTENIPGLVFEEVTVAEVGRTVPGPLGPVHGAMIDRELHMDEAALEQKTFGPGYGELFSGGGRTFEATALAVPTDASRAQMPRALPRLFAAALDVYRAIRSGRWSEAARHMRRLAAVRPADVPGRLGTELRDARAGLTRAAGARRATQASLAALDVASASLDVQLRYRPPREIDTARVRLWKLRLSTDEAGGDRASARGDRATLRWIRERLSAA